MLGKIKLEQEARSLPFPEEETQTKLHRGTEVHATMGSF